MSNRRVTRARSNLTSTQQPYQQHHINYFGAFATLAQSQVEPWNGGSARTAGIERHPWFRWPMVAQGFGHRPIPGWAGNWRQSNRSRNLQWGSHNSRRNATSCTNTANVRFQPLVPEVSSVSDNQTGSSSPSSTNGNDLSESMEIIGDSPPHTEDSNSAQPREDPNPVPNPTGITFTNLTTNPFVPVDHLPTSEEVNSQVDFKTAATEKKRNSSGRRTSEEKRKLDETMDESELCTICYEQWTTSGRHRLVCLKCGHLYGQECIEKWLDQQGKGTCPQCNAKASRRDIRCLYIRKLTAVDNSELERTKKELEEERTARKKAEMDLGLMRLRWQQLEDKCNVLKRDLAEQREQNITASKQMEVVLPSQVPSGSGRYQFEKSFTFEVGGCRALAYNPARFYLCASQASPSPLYPGFGIRKISTQDLRTNQYVPLHAKQIRDLSFHPTNERALLLSCSMDKTVKITSMESLETVQSFTCSSHTWSCTWNSDNTNHFYVGTQSGEVLLYDIRDTREHVATLMAQVPDSKSVVSLRHVPRSTSDSPGPGGLLVGQLDRSLFLEHHDSLNYFTHYLSSDSVLMSLHREEETGHVLASYRPTQSVPNIRHEVNDLVLAPKAPMTEVPAQPSSFYDRVSYDKVRSFTGGSSQQMLTRTVLVAHPDLGPRELFVCAGDGSSNKLYLWNVSTGNLQQQLIGPEQGISDICPITYDGPPVMLAAVGNKHLFVYKWKE